MAIIPVALALILGVLIVLWFKSTSAKSNERPLPPGPRGLPLVGNVSDLPPPGVLEAHHWAKHKDLYGPISSVTVLGTTIVLINDAKLAVEVLEKRSAIHSSRPLQIFAGELVGWDHSLGLSPYNDRFRTYRRNMSRIIGSKPLAAQFNDLQEEEVGHFLLKVWDKPEELENHIRREAGTVILKIVYGYNSEQQKEDPLIDMAGDAMDKFARAAVPGAFMVDMMPFLRYLPDWLPGQGWKKIANQWGSELRVTAEKPYAFTKHQMANGSNETSFLSKLLESGDSTPHEKLTNKWSAFSLYTAGADTTVSSILCLFLAMTVYPEVQRKAQEEIDRVIGSGRLPGMKDRDNLPYINAMVDEVLRWQPVAPMGLPHCSTEDDVINGHFVPKGTLTLANVWHFTHDPTVYDSPDEFRPERFLGDHPETDPSQFAFGFGRRICPGRVLADNALFLNIAQSLAVFDIKKALDENGKEIEPLVQMTPGIVSHPVPYKCRITPRSKHHEDLLKRVEQKWPWRGSDAEVLQSL